jgi:hypothetical protein
MTVYPLALEYSNESSRNPSSEEIINTFFNLRPFELDETLSSTVSEASHFEVYEESSYHSQSNKRNVLRSGFLTNEDLLLDISLPNKPLKKFYVDLHYEFVGKGKAHFNKEQYIES